MAWLQKTVTITRSSFSLSDIKPLPDLPKDEMPTTSLRHCQETYMRASASRLAGRFARVPSSPHEEPIFEEHAANVLKAEANATEALSSAMQATSAGVLCVTKIQTGEQERLLIADKAVLFSSINSARAQEGVQPVLLDAFFSDEVQLYADTLEDSEFSARKYKHLPMPPTTISAIMTGGARLISPPGVGALACGELWAGGKNRRHTTRSLLVGDPKHHESCPCRGKLVFDAMIDEQWRTVGIGKTGDGRWVVEFAPDKCEIVKTETTTETLLQQTYEKPGSAKASPKKIRYRAMTTQQSTSG